MDVGVAKVSRSGVLCSRECAGKHKQTSPNTKRSEKVVRLGFGYADGVLLFDAQWSCTAPLTADISRSVQGISEGKVSLCHPRAMIGLRRGYKTVSFFCRFDIVIERTKGAACDMPDTLFSDE